MIWIRQKPLHLTRCAASGSKICFCTLKSPSSKILRRIESNRRPTSRLYARTAYAEVNSKDSCAALRAAVTASGSSPVI